MDWNGLIPIIYIFMIMFWLVVVNFFLISFGVDIPSNSKYVGSSSGSNNNDGCGNNAENPCSTLSKGYSESNNAGSDKHVQILNDISIFETTTLSNGGTYYTYGIISNGIKPKVSGTNNNFYIDGQNSISWY
jgi:hypothetical protein